MTSRTENRIDHIIIIPPPSPSMADIASPSSLSVGSRNSSLQSISEPPTPSPPAVTVSNEDKYRQETDVPDEKEHLSLSDMEAVLHTASLIERGCLGGKKNFAFARLLMELLEQDRPEKTASFYRKKSLEENQSCAQTSLGQAYWFGNGVEQDLTKAQEYLALAAQGGNARAWMLLGHLPHEDERNSTVEEAFACLQEGDSRGDICSRFHVAQAMQDGIGVEKDEKESKRLFEEVFEERHQLDAEELRLLGDRFMTGDGVDQSKAKAICLLHLSAHHNYVPGVIGLGNAFYYGDVLGEEGWEAAYYAGDMLLNESTIETNPELAAKFFAIGSEYGNVQCKRELAQLYESGNGVPTNLLEASRLYREADGYSCPDIGTQCSVCMENVDPQWMLILFPCGHENLCMECCWRQKICLTTVDGETIGQVPETDITPKCPTCRKDVKCCFRRVLR